jgi:large subunit ribosomal protein L1
VPEKDLPRAIGEAQAGRVEFRLDDTANIHVPIGKVSFEEDALYENLAVLMHGIKKARPAAAKGTYVKRISLSSTMGPSIMIDPSQALDMELKN